MLWLLVAAFLFLMLAGVPIAVAMLAGAAVFAVVDPSTDMIALPHKIFTGLDSFVLVAVPFFLLVGHLMNTSGVLERLLDLSRILVGRLPGGLAQVNIAGSIFSAGISGSAVGDAASIGSMLIPAMTREKYDRAFSAAITAASSTIGPIIPPSIIMVVLGALVEVSVGKLFLAGVLPGLLVGLLLMLVTHVISVRRGYGRLDVHWNLNELLVAIGRALGPLLIPLVIIGGIVGGIFTPTEAAVIAVALVVLLGAVYRTLTLRGIWRALQDSIYLLGPVMIAIAAGHVFGAILIENRVGLVISSSLLKVASNPIIILLLIAVVVLIMGCFLEAMPLMFILAPILMPVVTSVGIDPVHFGLVLVQGLMIGLITPPVGVCMFITCGISGNTIGEFTRAVWPFFLILVAALLVSILFPSFVLFLPALIMG